MCNIPQDVTVKRFVMVKQLDITQNFEGVIATVVYNTQHTILYMYTRHNCIHVHKTQLSTVHKIHVHNVLVMNDNSVIIIFMITQS